MRFETIVLILLSLPAHASSPADEVRRLRAKVETLLKSADRDMRRAPRLQKKALEEKAKGDSLRSELESANAEAERAAKEAADLEAEVKTAEAEVAAEKEKAAALTGFQKRAWDRLARKPQDPQAALVRLALRDRAMVTEILGRLTAEPAAKAGEAFEELRKAAAEPLPADAFAALGEGLRPAPRPRATPDALTTWDALAEAMVEAAGCAGLGADSLDLPALPSAPRAADVAKALDRLARRLERKLRDRRAALEQTAKSALPPLLAAMGGERLARAVVRAALGRGLREPAWEAARAALAAFAKPAGAPPERSLATPKVARALLKRIEKTTGFTCDIEGGR